MILENSNKTNITPPIIEVEGLVKRYGDFTAVNGISFRIWEGEVFGLLGPNGAGKTTTMEMMEGLRKPDGGYARVAGFDTQTSLRKVKEVIGVQLQSTSLFELLTVKEIMKMYASFYKKTLPIDALLDEMILADKARDRVKNLSGGQKQRLAIALALIHDPKVIFLDEPTTGLDPQARRVIWDIINGMKKRGKTIVLSTHYMDEAHTLCDRVCLMDKGEIVALDTPENLILSLPSHSAIEFKVDEKEFSKMSGDDLKDELARLDHVKKIKTENGWFILYSERLESSLIALIQFSEQKGIGLKDLRTRSATLEDVFLQYTGRRLREE